MDDKFSQRSAAGAAASPRSARGAFSVRATVRILLIAGTIVPLLGGTATGQSTPAADRPSDGLLCRPDLQRLVDLQTARDASALIEALTRDDDAVRARAAFALASVQDSTAAGPFLRLMADSVDRVRADAAFALGQLTGQLAGDEFLAALDREREATVRRRILEALGKRGDATSLDTLARLDVSVDERPALALAIARYALRDIHAGAAVQRLLDLLDDGDARTRVDAAYYFGRSRRTEPWDPHADALRSRLDALAPYDPAAGHLVTALGRLEAPDDADRIVHWLRTARDWRTRVDAARALAGYTSDDAVRDAIVTALDDSVHHVAVTASGALADAAEWAPHHLDAATDRVRDTPVDTSGAANRIAGALLEGIARQGETTFVLDEIDRRAATPAHRHVLRALTPLSFEEAYPRLRIAARSPDARIAFAALAVLTTRWRSGRDTTRAAAYYDVLAPAAIRGDVATVYATAPLLADTAFVELGSVDVLVKTYDALQTPRDLESMAAILDALGQTGSPGARPALDDALSHPHPVLRRAAARALEAITGENVPAVEAGHGVDVPTLDWAYLEQMGTHPRLMLETLRGTMTITFDTEEAPLTTQTLLRLADDGAYDGVPFHRVVPDFVIQGGDFARGDGFGGPSFVIRSEFTRIPYRRGTAGMASAGKDTEGSQFFVTHSMQPHLDGRYTAFGHVTGGRDVVDAMQVDDRILEATVIADTEPACE